MNRKEFIRVAGGGIVIGGVAIYFMSNKISIERIDTKERGETNIILTPDERQILFLASLAPSGHNTQPWFITYLEPYHWIICNDKNNWLNEVDPTQRETILSIGAFIQNLEYAANDLGYLFEFSNVALTNQDKSIITVKFKKSRDAPIFNIKKILKRRTLRSHYLSTSLKHEDQLYLFNEKSNYFHFISNKTKEYSLINEQTIKANTIQAYRDNAQRELANWIRFSTKDEDEYRSGLTIASLEIEGITAWLLKNFYGKADVMKNSFRERSIDKIKEEVSASAGWLLITSKSNSVIDLLETGKRMERLFLKVRERSIALHLMTQVLEEQSIKQSLILDLNINDPIQFVIRVGYVKNYPEPVSLRRPVDWWVYNA